VPYLSEWVVCPKARGLLDLLNQSNIGSVLTMDHIIVNYYGNLFIFSNLNLWVIVMSSTKYFYRPVFLREVIANLGIRGKQGLGATKSQNLGYLGLGVKFNINPCMKHQNASTSKDLPDGNTSDLHMTFTWPSDDLKGILGLVLGLG